MYSYSWTEYDQLNSYWRDNRWLDGLKLSLNKLDYEEAGDICKEAKHPRFSGILYRLALEDYTKELDYYLSLGDEFDWEARKEKANIARVKEKLSNI